MTRADANSMKLPWIPIFGLKLRRELRKNGIMVVFKSSADLKSILCQNESFFHILIMEYMSVFVNQDILVKQKRI